jgi:hypothetical protein
VANAVRSNKILIDSTGSVSTLRTKVVYALFTSVAAGDSVVLRETQTDTDILVISAGSATDSKLYRFDAYPLVFGNGVYVQSISSGAKLLLVTTTGGGQ